MCTIDSRSASRLTDIHTGHHPTTIPLLFLSFNAVLEIRALEPAFGGHGSYNRPRDWRYNIDEIFDGVFLCGIEWFP